MSHHSLPAKLLSDNAKTFKAAGEVKKLVHTEEVRQYCTNRQVSWEYIVEKALWWGVGADGTVCKGLFEETHGMVLIDI